MEDSELDFDIARQPDDISCGATCLHAIYRFFGEAIDFAEVVSGIPTLAEGAMALSPEPPGRGL